MKTEAEIRETLDLLDCELAEAKTRDVAEVLGMAIAPLEWALGSGGDYGRNFKAYLEALKAKRAGDPNWRNGMAGRIAEVKQALREQGE